MRPSILPSRRPMFALARCLVVFAVLAACGCGDRQPGKQPSGPVVIAVVPKVSGSAYFGLCLEGMREAAKGRDYEFVERGPDGSDPDKQVAIVEELIDQKVAAILIALWNRV